MIGLKHRTVEYRRKREGKTNYPKRLHLLLSSKPRVVVRFSKKKIVAQVVEFTPRGDIVRLGIDSSALRKKGWTYSLSNLPAAYLAGLLFGKEAVKKGHKECILDVGLRTPLPGGKTYSFLRGVLDGGLQVPHSEEKIFPDMKRISGEHIKNYGDAVKKNKSSGSHQFTQYLKKNVLPEQITVQFQEVKKKILQG